MYVRFLKLWDDLRSSYWFIPSLMTVTALGAAIGTIALDVRLGSEWIDEIPWLYANKAEGARAVLSTIAGSMITVAGVAFSITVAAVVYASGQYGPRLLSNFMRDRGNQVTLGTFIATFIYCLHILRTVRSSEEGGPAVFNVAETAGGFVPHLGMVGALALTLCSIGVLIFFIHHVPGSIHISNVIGGIGQELREQIEERFPERFGRAPNEEELGDEREAFADRAYCVIEADGSGYIQAMNERALLRQAQAHDLVLRLESRPGDYVRPGKPIVLAYPADRVTEAVADEIRLAFAWGRRRSPTHDFMFLVDELVEIAARALSPGINDPFTARSCLDWLGGGVAVFAERDIPEQLRLDKGGRLRVIAQPISFAEYVEASFGQLRPYVAADRNATLHMLSVLQDLGLSIDTDERRSVLRDHAMALVTTAEASITDRASLELIRVRYAATLGALRAEDQAAGVVA